MEVRGDDGWPTSWPGRAEFALLPISTTKKSDAERLYGTCWCSALKSGSRSVPEEWCLRAPPLPACAEHPKAGMGGGPKARMLNWARSRYEHTHTHTHTHTHVERQTQHQTYGAVKVGHSLTLLWRRVYMKDAGVQFTGPKGAAAAAAATDPSLAWGAQLQRHRSAHQPRQDQTAAVGDVCAPLRAIACLRSSFPLLRSSCQASAGGGWHCPS